MQILSIFSYEIVYSNSSPLIKREIHLTGRSDCECFHDILVLKHFFFFKEKKNKNWYLVAGGHFLKTPLHLLESCLLARADRHLWHPPEALMQSRFSAETWHMDVENYRTDQQKIKLFGESNNGKNSFWLNNVRDWESNKLYMVIAWIALHNWCTQSYIMYQLSTCEMCLKK